MEREPMSRALEKKLHRDLSSEDGAAHLAKCIETYWAKQGVTVAVRLEPVPTGDGSPIIAVRSVGIPGTK